MMLPNILTNKGQLLKSALCRDIQNHGMKLFVCELQKDYLCNAGSIFMRFLPWWVKIILY